MLTPTDLESFFSGRDFQRFFAQSMQSLIIRANHPFFTIVAVSDAYLSMVQMSREEVINRHLFEVFPDSDSDPSGRSSAMQAFIDVIETHAPVELPVYRYEIFVPAENRMVSYYWANKNEPVLSADGSTVEFIINTTTNITDRILLEKARQDARREVELVQQRINMMFMNAPIGMVMLSRDNYIIEYANQMMYKMWNKGSGEQLIGRSVFSVIRELEANGLRAVYDKVVQESEAFYQTDVPVTYDRDGVVKTYYFNIHMEPVHNLAGHVTGLMILAHDTTESLASRRDIEASEERLRMASEATGLGTYDVDIVNNVIVHSPELAMIFGQPADRKLSWSQFVNIIHPEDRPIRDRAYARALRTGIYNYEARLDPGEGLTRWMRAVAKVYFDSGKKPVRIIGTVIDITEDKLREIRKNDFLAIASHELKTPLTSLKLLLGVLGGGYAAAADYTPTALLEKSNQQVNKMTALIHDFLDLSRIESGKVEFESTPTNLNDLVVRVIDEQRILLAAGYINFEPGEIPVVPADSDKLAQVLDNLLNNAIKYSGREPQIRVRTFTSGEEVIVSVSDNGIGIDESHHPRIFQRFYRVDQQQAKLFAGFGIGLYLSADIIERHQGRIWVESRKGEGSTFFFSLPFADNPLPPVN
ncbi:MAG: PAS domain S-box protein [Chitinophagaceae bacterium]|nr:MAG: PAS domain S-box protein [Chitinophagaceae bacterium]